MSKRLKASARQKLVTLRLVAQMEKPQCAAAGLDARLTRTQGGLNDGNRAVGKTDLQANFGVEWDKPFIPA